MKIRQFHNDLLESFDVYRENTSDEAIEYLYEVTSDDNEFHRLWSDPTDVELRLIIYNMKSRYELKDSYLKDLYWGDEDFESLLERLK